MWNKIIALSFHSISCSLRHWKKHFENAIARGHSKGIVAYIILLISSMVRKKIFVCPHKLKKGKVVQSEMYTLSDFRNKPSKS